MPSIHRCGQTKANDSVMVTTNLCYGIYTSRRAYQKRLFAGFKNTAMFVSFFFILHLRPVVCISLGKIYTCRRANQKKVFAVLQTPQCLFHSSPSTSGMHLSGKERTRYYPNQTMNGIRAHFLSVG